MTMHAYEIPNLRFSAEAVGAIPANRFVVIDANGLCKIAGAGEAVVGVSKSEATAAGQVIDINDGIIMVVAGAVVAAGAEVQSNADGKAITLAAGKRAGYAMTGGAAGEFISVKI